MQECPPSWAEDREGQNQSSAAQISLAPRPFHQPPLLPPSQNCAGRPLRGGDRVRRVPHPFFLGRLWHARRGGGAHHNDQGCWSYEAPDEVGVQAEPAAASRRGEKSRASRVSAEDKPAPGPTGTRRADELRSRGFAKAAGPRAQQEQSQTLGLS